MFCDGSGLSVAVSGDPDTCVANGGGARTGHVSSHTQGWPALRYGENPFSVILHTHMCCRSKEPVVTVPLSDCSTHLVMSVHM